MNGRNPRKFLFSLNYRKNFLRFVKGLPVTVPVAAFILLLLSFTSCGKRASELPQPENIILITLDTTRADRLNCYGYSHPTSSNLDKLAASGTRFERAYTPVPLTLPAHASILTGLNPYHHRVHNNGNYVLPSEVKTLAEILKEKGYRTAAFVSSFTLDKRFGLDRGFDVYDDWLPAVTLFKNLSSERSAAEVFKAFSSWFEKEKPEKFFCWVHFYDPHFPYQPPPEYAAKFSDPYDGEIAFMDYYVGLVLELLDEAGLTGKTAIIAVGDHGEAFGEKVEEGHGLFLYEMSVRVPLIIRGPGIKPGEISHDLVSLVDLAPTILDWFGARAEVQFDGKSLLRVLSGKKEKTRDIYLETFYPRENYGWSELVGIISWPWKFIQAPRPELYNLEKDPQENQNLAGGEERTAAMLAGRLQNLLAGKGEDSGSRRELTAAERERLRSLGYLQVFSGGTKGPLPDPKDKTDELKLFQEASRLEQNGQFREAEEVYSRLLGLNPEAESLYIELARVQGEQKNFRKAAETLREGARKFPSSEYLLSRLAHALYLSREYDEAQEVAMNLLRMNAGNFEALVVLGLCHEEKGDLERALDSYERALFQEPSNEFLLLSRAELMLRLGRYQEAFETYSKLHELYPENPSHLLNMGITCNLMGEYDKAIPYLEKALAISPSPKAYLNLAVAYLEQKRLSEAAGALEKYLQNTKGEDPENVARARSLLRRLK